MEPIILRAVERILAVIIGGLCVYLGYRLFLHIPNQKDSEGKIKLPGGISIFVTRVGPGVFFVLFGASVVALSLYQGIVYFRERPSDPKTHSRSDIEIYGGLTPRRSTEDREKLERDRLRLRLEVEFLNTLPSLLRVDLSDEQRREFTTRIPSTKLALMKTVWGPDWGDFDEFILWVESDALDPVPKGLETAAAYYRSGQEVAK
jgi:hypothetical protein